MRLIVLSLLSIALGFTASAASVAATAPTAATAAAASVAPTGLEIVRVMPAYHKTDDFKRISEYFSGKENTGGAIVIRTQPAQRAGYYFLVRVKTPVPIEVAWIEVQVITPTNPEPRINSFAVSIPAGSQVIKLGLTGTDWSDAKAVPVAWKLRFLSSAGNPLASEQSFLWSKPPGPSVAVR